MNELFTFLQKGISLFEQVYNGKSMKTQKFYWSSRKMKKKFVKNLR